MIWLRVPRLGKPLQGDVCFIGIDNKKTIAKFRLKSLNPEKQKQYWLNNFVNNILKH